MMPVTVPVRRLQRGFTLVELMIAILVGLFLTGGLVMMLQSNRRSFTNQNQLSQLQDSERMAMNIITDMVQIAGYFPDPTTNTALSTMPAITAPMTLPATQYLSGVHAAAAPGDTLTVRFASQPNDGILNCAGTSNSTAAIQSYINTFFVNNSQQLVCRMGLGGAAYTDYPLIGEGTANAVIKVTNLQVLYGIDTTGSSNNVNQYQTADQVTTAGAWNKVISAQIRLTLSNPLYDATKANNQGQPATVDITRTAAVMNQVGL